MQRSQGRHALGVLKQQQGDQWDWSGLSKRSSGCEIMQGSVALSKDLDLE